MLTILGWLWQSKTFLGKYTPENVNIWARMINRNLTLPHRFVVATDTPKAAFDPLVTAIPLWPDWRDLQNKRWPGTKPQCYVRLKAFSEQARELIGERFVSVDLDCLVTGNLDSLLDRTDDFLIFRRYPQCDRDKLNTYVGAMWMMNAGARQQVWNDFKGQRSIDELNAKMRLIGSDQAWIRYKLGPNEPGWSLADGVWTWPQVKEPDRYRAAPPEGCRIIFFNGEEKPEHCLAPIRPRETLKYPWVREFYR